MKIVTPHQHVCTSMFQENVTSHHSVERVVQMGVEVEEFIQEDERVLRSREQTPAEKCDYIVSLLRGHALEEV